MDSVVFCCQGCRCRLAISGLEPASSSEDNSKQPETPEALDPSSTASGESAYGGLSVEESFVLLEHKKGQKSSSLGPGGGLRTLGESFVVLGPASLLRQNHGEGPVHNAGASLDSKVGH